MHVLERRDGVARQRPGVGAAGTGEDGQGGETTVDRHIPDHHVGQPISKVYPDRIGNGDVVRVVQTPVAAGKHLCRDARVDDDAVDRHVGQVA